MSAPTAPMAQAEPPADRFQPFTTHHENTLVWAGPEASRHALFFDSQAPLGALLASLESRVDRLCDLSATFSHIRDDEEGVPVGSMAFALSGYLEEVRDLLSHLNRRLRFGSDGERHREHGGQAGQALGETSRMRPAP